MDSNDMAPIFTDITRITAMDSNDTAPIFTDIARISSNAL